MAKKKKDETPDGTDEQTNTLVIDMDKFRASKESVSMEGPIITIEKANIKSNSIGLKYSTNMNGSAATLSLESSCTPHGDLIEKMGNLRFHLIKLCDLHEYKHLEREDFSEATNITVSSFTIAGGGEREGIVISGSKKIGSKMINLNTPFTVLNHEIEDYPWIDDLQRDVQEVIEEIKLFINHGKCGEAQVSLEFPDEEDEGVGAAASNG